MYGGLVMQLLRDFEEPEEVNAQLVKLGRNIGYRLVDDFFAKSGVSRCVDFRDTAESVARVGFKMFLGLNARVCDWSGDQEHPEFSVVLEDNPLADFVELPEKYVRSLWYSNLYCGVIEGALEMVQYRVSCRFVKDTLRGDDSIEFRVRLEEVLKDEPPFKDED